MREPKENTVRTLTIFILFLISLSSSSQTYSSIIRDSTIIDFLNWEIKNTKKFSEGKSLFSRKKVSNKILQFDTANFILPLNSNGADWNYPKYLFKGGNIDTLFSEEDRNYFFEQFIANMNTVWEHKIKNGQIKKWSTTKYVYYYSVPLFSPDRKYVMMKKFFYCGNVCAYGGTYLYKKISPKKWELVEILNGWMS